MGTIFEKLNSYYPLFSGYAQDYYRIFSIVDTYFPGHDWDLFMNNYLPEEKSETGPLWLFDERYLVQIDLPKSPWSFKITKWDEYFSWVVEQEDISLENVIGLIPSRRVSLRSRNGDDVQLRAVQNDNCKRLDEIMRKYLSSW